jgi:uncharacterized membrane protein YdjX (TVP38/TMEM64 family)
LPASPGPGRATAFRILLAVLAVLAIAAAFLHPRVREAVGAWSVEGLKERFLALGAWAPAFSALLMVLQALASPLPAFVITIANGYVFGPFWGGLLALASATLAAQLCFEIARALGRPAVERWVGGRVLERADRFFARHGAWAILVARLLPFVPFDPISYAAGLTTTGRLRFVSANLIGQLPATFIYSTLGSRLEGGKLPLAALAAFSLAALAVIVLVAVRTRQRDGQPPGFFRSFGFHPRRSKRR